MQDRYRLENYENGKSEAPKAQEKIRIYFYNISSKVILLTPNTHKNQKHVFWNNIGRSEFESKNPEIPEKSGRFSSMI